MLFCFMVNIMVSVVVICWFEMLCLFIIDSVVSGVVKLIKLIWIRVKVFILVKLKGFSSGVI